MYVGNEFVHNFLCTTGGFLNPCLGNRKTVGDTGNAAWRANERVFGVPFVPSGF